MTHPAQKVTVITGTTLTGVFKTLGVNNALANTVNGFKNMAAAQRYARDTSAELVHTYKVLETKEMDLSIAKIRGEKIFDYGSAYLTA